MVYKGFKPLLFIDRPDIAIIFHLSYQLGVQAQKRGFDIAKPFTPLIGRQGNGFKQPL
jgi:hypothetical protein